MKKLPWVKECCHMYPEVVHGLCCSLVNDSSNLLTRLGPHFNVITNALFSVFKRKILC